MKATVIIPAAGLGRRFGAKKQFLLLEGKPVLIHTLEVFERSPSIEGACVAVPETEIASVREMIAQYALKKPIQVVPGGKERQDSVRLGFEAIDSCDIVVIHDGVRPLVTPEVIEKTIQGALEFGSCVAALPVKETIKRVSAEGFIQGTVDRSDLWSIQTPQAFRYEIFKKAVQKSVADGFLGTDEAMLVERWGFGGEAGFSPEFESKHPALPVRDGLTQKIKVVAGDPVNIKITSPEDLRVAESLLRTRQTL